MRLLEIVAWTSMIVGAALFGASFFVDTGWLRSKVERWLVVSKVPPDIARKDLHHELDAVFDEKWNIVRGTGFGLFVFGLLLLKRQHS